MKKYSFFMIFMVTQLGLIFLQIHKHMQFIKQSFRKQKNERLLVECTHKKEELINQLYAEQSRTDIGQFAKDHGLKSAKLSQVKRITHDV